MQIELTKIDIATDLKGSFIPDNVDLCHRTITGYLSRAIETIFCTDECNFLSLNSIYDLHLIRGDNNLETCFQYAVLDVENDKLLNIKFYDKTLDLISRDGR